MRTLTRALIALAAVVAASVPVLPAVAATTAPSAAAVGPVAGDVDDFTFGSMHADYTIGRDADGASTLKVVETFVAVFPETDQNRGMKRVIPDSYNGQPLDPTVLSVTDGQGRPRPFETDSDDDGRPRLEALLDRVQPGWRDEVVDVRSGRRLEVAHGRPLPGRGFAGRPQVAVPDVPGLFVAGDWVGDQGLLTDAVLASARAAGVAAAHPAVTAGGRAVRMSA